MRRTEVIVIGGPKHGQVLDILDGHHRIEVPNPRTPRNPFSTSPDFGRDRITYLISYAPFGTERLRFAHPSWMSRGTAVSMLTEAIFADDAWSKRL